MPCNIIGGMGIYTWDSNTLTPCLTKLKLIQTPILHYATKNKPKNIHEFIKCVIIKKTAYRVIQYSYE